MIQKSKLKKLMMPKGPHDEMPEDHMEGMEEAEAPGSDSKEVSDAEGESSSDHEMPSTPLDSVSDDELIAEMKKRGIKQDMEEEGGDSSNYDFTMA